MVHPRKETYSIIRHLRWLLVMLFSLSSIACSGIREASNSTQETLSIVIANVAVIDINTGTKVARDILIQRDRIVDIQAPGRLNKQYRQHSENLTVIDATGRYAIPGLWDMHVHMTYLPEIQDDWMSPLFIANGVTSVRDMGGELDKILALQQQANQPDSLAPHVWIAGPLIDGSPPIANGLGDLANYPAMSLPVDTPQEAIQLVDQLAASGVNLIKPYEMLRPEVFSAMAKRAHHHGLLVDGHVPQRMTISEAIEAGMDGVAHMKGVDYGCSRDPQALKMERVSMLNQADREESGAHLQAKVSSTVTPKAMAQQDLSRCDALIKLFVEKGTWHTPGISTEAFLAKSNRQLSRWHERLQYLPTAAKERKQRDYDRFSSADYKYAKSLKIMTGKHAWKQQLIKKMHRAGVKLLAGTDTPALMLPGFGLHNELEVLVQAGLSPLAALQTATINPAQFFNVQSEQGSIDVGKVADLVLLNADPLADINNTHNIHAVIVRGRVFDRTALDLLLAQESSPN